MNEKTFTQSEIYEIIDQLIKNEIERKNKYIALNGYKHKDTLNSFSANIATLSSLYKYFK